VVISSYLPEIMALSDRILVSRRQVVEDAIGQRHDLGQIGRDHHDRLAFIGEPLDQLVDLDESHRTSTPRVGSSKMIRSGSCTSDLAITTSAGCRLTVRRPSCHCRWRAH